jgi:hypothetical protein
VILPLTQISENVATKRGSSSSIPLSQMLTSRPPWRTSSDRPGELPSGTMQGIEERKTFSWRAMSWCNTAGSNWPEVAFLIEPRSVFTLPEERSKHKLPVNQYQININFMR